MNVLVQILTVCLLVEVGKGRKSWWYPYLVQLPRHYDTLSNFTRFEIQALQIEDAKWVSDKAVSNARSEWKEAVLVMQEIDLKSQLRSFRSWLWASATISSRTLHVPWDSAGCLCPVGDLFNYAAPEEEYSSDVASSSEHNDTEGALDAKQLDSYSVRLTDGGYEDETASYCFYAKRCYRKGEQVLLSYGTYTNLELLEHYGFLLDMNPNDKAFIELDADVCKISSWPKDSLYIQPDGSPSFALLCALRLWATPANHRKAVKHMFYTGSLLSVENELFIMKWLAKKCQQLLGRMLSTIDEDNLLLRCINMMLDQPSCVEGVEACSCRELESFLQVNCLVNQATESQLSVKAKRSLERFELVIKWRLSHKTMLLNCVSYCQRISDSLPSQH
ncbi:Histone-lysine N-methyltransferase protein [Dioscorea alata]|uniref:Histone-lysine N-methyltransferase protein n=1 Tax=Dioscorea alata TaxID=55571 RepID=A0ACB7TZR2_DIOAL|nr:Histone-lysine N-methyltransferase protein [Dioscorea alata]